MTSGRSRSGARAGRHRPGPWPCGRGSCRRVQGRTYRRSSRSPQSCGWPRTRSESGGGASSPGGRTHWPASRGRAGRPPSASIRTRSWSWRPDAHCRAIATAPAPTGNRVRPAPSRTRPSSATAAIAAHPPSSRTGRVKTDRSRLSSKPATQSTAGPGPASSTPSPGGRPTRSSVTAAYAATASTRPSSPWPGRTIWPSPGNPTSARDTPCTSPTPAYGTSFSRSRAGRGQAEAERERKCAVADTPKAIDGTPPAGRSPARKRGQAGPRAGPWGGYPVAKRCPSPAAAYRAGPRWRYSARAGEQPRVQSAVSAGRGVCRARRVPGAACAGRGVCRARRVPGAVGAGRGGCRARARVPADAQGVFPAASRSGR